MAGRASFNTLPYEITSAILFYITPLVEPQPLLRVCKEWQEIYEPV